MAKENKRNRISVNVEDSILYALDSLANKEQMTMSELCRQIILSELNRLDLMPDVSIKRLAGIRD